jgi:hypothetical protein
LVLSPAPSDAYGAASGQSGRWNEVAPDFAPQTLLDLAGNATSVTVVMDHTSTRNIFPSVMPPGDDQALMEDIADMPNLGVVVTWNFTGLADGSYDIYTYAADPSSDAVSTLVTVVGSSDPPAVVGGVWPAMHQLGITYTVHSASVSGGMLEMKFLALGLPNFEAGAVNGIQFVPSGGPVGTSYCGPATPNTTGSPGRITGSGSGAAGDLLILTASDLAQNTFGFFLAGRTQGFFQPPGSAGFICLSGNIGRFNRPGEIGFSGPTGTISLTVDTTSIPNNPPVAALPGEVWYFQCWFRDVSGSTSSNFTDGLRVQFL